MYILLPPTKIPTVVYRGDDRDPSIIFKKGFRAKTQDNESVNRNIRFTDLLYSQQDGFINSNSVVSMTQSPSIASVFPQTNTIFTYVYAIKCDHYSSTYIEQETTNTWQNYAKKIVRPENIIFAIGCARSTTGESKFVLDDRIIKNKKFAKHYPIEIQKEAEHYVKKFQLCVAKPPSTDREFIILRDLWRKSHTFKMKSNVIQPSRNPDNCSICKDKFTFFFRKHLCHYCGDLICSDCSKINKSSFRTHQGETYRICSECLFLDILDNGYNKFRAQNPLIGGSRRYMQSI